MSQLWRNDFGAMSYMDDVEHFQMTRLSDVIGNVASEGNPEDTNEAADESESSKLDPLIVQMKQQNKATENKKVFQGSIKSLKEKDQEIVKKQASPSKNSIPSIKYGRKDLLMLGTSSLCKLPPPNLTDLPAVVVKSSPNLTDLPGLMMKRLQLDYHSSFEEAGKSSSGQKFIQDERKKKKKKNRKAREKKPYDPLNDNMVHPLFRKDDSKDQQIHVDNSNDDLSKMVIDEDNNSKSYVQERPQKLGLGISRHLFRKAVADLTRQRN